MRALIKEAFESLLQILIVVWSYCRVPIYLSLSLALAFFAGYVASKGTGLAYDRIIASYRWLDHLTNGAAVASDAAPLTTGQIFAGVAVGATVLMTSVRDLLTSVEQLWPWNLAERRQILPAMVALFVSGLGVFISAFALGTSGPHSAGLTVAFDGMALPPMAAAPQGRGLVSFYIPFYEEASFGALVQPDDPSIRVPPVFEPFLRNFGDVLTRCAKPGEHPVQIRVSGFASVTKWYAFESDTAPNKLPHVRALLRQHYQELNGEYPTAAVLDSMMQKFQESRSQVALLETRELDRAHPYASWPDAFNLWLAYKRRDAVIQALHLGNLSPILQLTPTTWTNYKAMDTALAVDDHSTISLDTTGGLLSRSVRVTILNAGSCENKSTEQGAVFTTANTAP